MSIKKPTKTENELLDLLDDLRNWYLYGMQNEFYDEARNDKVWTDLDKVLCKWGIR